MRGTRQNGGGHPVNDGHFGFFTVSLLEKHFDFPFLFVYIYVSYSKFYHAPLENKIQLFFVEWRRFFLRHFLLKPRWVYGAKV